MAEWDAAGLRWTQWDWFPGPRRADLGRVTRARTSIILLPQILRHHSVDAQRRDAMQRCRGMKAGDPEKLSSSSVPCCTRLRDIGVTNDPRVKRLRRKLAHWGAVTGYSNIYAVPSSSARLSAASISATPT